MLTVDEKRIRSLLKSKQEEAQRALDRYQETGKPGDYTRYTTADDTAQALQMALDAADDKEYTLWAKAAIERLRAIAEQGDAEALISEVLFISK